jgi:hypothetical protein
MAHEIFISYSAEDRESAGAVCAALEKEGLGCWIAPRDILPGDIYGESIIRAINDSQLLVVVFSSRANQSPHVLTEVDRALNKRKTIVRLNIENVDLSARFEYYLSTAQWLDASTPLTAAQLQTLTSVVKSKLGRPASSALTQPPNPKARPAKRPAPKTTRRKPTVTAPTPPVLVPRVPSSPPKVAGSGRGYIVGRVNRYYDALGVAGVDVLDTFQVGDTVRILGPATDFEEKVRSIQLNRLPVERVTGNYKIGLKVSQTVSVGDEVFKVVFRSNEPASSPRAAVKETLVGTVDHYYGRAGAATVQLSKPLKLNDVIRFRGATTDFTQTVVSMEMDRVPVTRARGGVLVGIAVTDAVRVGDQVYVLSEKK